MSRCRSCRREWSSLIECHCATCHRHFAGHAAFAEHRHDGICHDPARSGRLCVRETRWGEVWGHPGTDPRWSEPTLFDSP